MVSFGGSYSGALSAWLRQTYPEVIHAAVSTSSPILAQQNFMAYHQVVQTSLATAPEGARCVAHIQNVTQHLESLVEDDPAALAGLFNLCDPTLGGATSGGETNDDVTSPAIHRCV